MKKTENQSVSEQMRNTPKTITDENLHLYPKEIQDFYLLVKEKGKAHFLTPKYYKSLFSHQHEELMKLHEKNPTMPINKVVAQRIGTLPDFIPADKIIEITTFLVKNWQELTTKEAVAA